MSQNFHRNPKFPRHASPFALGGVNEETLASSSHYIDIFKVITLINKFLQLHKYFNAVEILDFPLHNDAQENKCRQ